MKRISIVAFACLVYGNLQAQFIVNNGISLTNTTTLVTNGDWVNTADSNIKNDGIISTSETFTNSGTLDPTSTGGFVLNFATNKNFTPGGTSFGFLTKEGAGNATIIGQFTVRDSLSLQGGLITPSTTSDVLTVAETGTVSSVPGSFVDGGNLVRNGTGDLFFPVGKDGIELPITFLNVRGTNPSITVEVVDAPAGYTAGAGIDALLAFPYAWSTTKSNVADTANYVEVEYPNTLPTAANGIVIRKAGATSYEGMGARAYSNTAGTVRIRSYSRGLQGLFSVASGFAGNLETDSLALVDFYNATGATAWTKDANWLSGTIGTWQGVTETGGAITALTLDAANINGAMNAEVADILSLQSVNVAGNNLTAIPDFSALPLTSLNVSGNKLDFASLEGNATLGASIVNYSNQQPIDLQLGDSVLVDAGADYTLITTVGGTQNTYDVTRNSTSVGTNTQGTYQIPAINRSNMGTYQVTITNSLVPNLTLTTLPVSILGVADISGSLRVSASSPATDGRMDLYRITPSGAYEKADSIMNINSDGTYRFENIVLDDYLVLGRPEVSLYPLVIPTYYSATIFWEEASTVALNANRTDVNIIAQFIPTNVPTGTGSLTGYLEEDDGTGRTEKTKRVGGAGVTARKVEATGRGQETILTVVAYVETNEEGEFSIPELANGKYRLNIQYPGYPMDETSFIEFDITSNPLQNDIQIAAAVVANKITVRQLVITGVFEATDYQVEIYPNPATENIKVSFAGESTARELILLDALGKALKTKSVPAREGMLNVSELPAGTYLLQVKDKNAVKKIVRIVIE